MGNAATDQEMTAIFALVEIADLADEAVLDLSSLQVVTLVEEIERTFSVHLRAADAIRTNFVSKAAIRALVARKIEEQRS